MRLDKIVAACRNAPPNGAQNGEEDKKELRQEYLPTGNSNRKSSGKSAETAVLVAPTNGVAYTVDRSSLLRTCILHTFRLQQETKHRTHTTCAYL